MYCCCFARRGHLGYFEPHRHASGEDVPTLLQTTTVYPDAPSMLKLCRISAQRRAWKSSFRQEFEQLHRGSGQLCQKSGEFRQEFTQFGQGSGRFCREPLQFYQVLVNPYGKEYGVNHSVENWNSSVRNRDSLVRSGDGSVRNPCDWSKVGTVPSEPLQFRQKPVQVRRECDDPFQIQRSFSKSRDNFVKRRCGFVKSRGISVTSRNRSVKSPDSLVESRNSSVKIRNSPRRFLHLPQSMPGTRTSKIGLTSSTPG